jgi:hypothetical protein
MNFKFGILSAVISMLMLCHNLYAFDFERDTVACVDRVYGKNLKTVRMHLHDWEVSYPVMELYGEVGLEFSFDQIESQPQNYYYTVMHCTYDWKPSNLMFVDYADGFDENEIRNYEESQSTYVQYTHFSLNLPNDDLQLKLSGNYLLIVFVKEPEERIVCTKRFMVYENLVTVEGRVNSNVFGEFKKEYQKVDFEIIPKKYPIYNPLEELKVTLVQNFQCDESYTEMQPSFVGNDSYIFNWEDKYLFNAGNEYRYFNFNNLELNSEYVEHIEYRKPYYYIDLVPGKSKYFEPYASDEDINGGYIIKTNRRNNNNFPEIQSEYAIVRFRLNNPSMLGGASVYLYGALTNYELSSQYKMKYNMEAHCYELLMFLKQGYYNYRYVVVPEGEGAGMDRFFFEGSHKQTENDYLLFVYHRNPSESYDRLINYTKFNSRN